MAATPETKAKKQIQKLLEFYRGGGLKMKLVWNAGASYGVATLDCTGAISGVPVAIEAKRFDGKGKVTARQLADLREYRDAGAVAMLIDSEETLEHLGKFLEARMADPTVPLYRDWSNVP